MKNIQFLFEGGLGNQLFQYFASKYISENFKDLKINYALARSILVGYRDFEASKIIKEPILISNEYKRFAEKLYPKIISNLPSLSNKNKMTFVSHIDLINGIYNEKINQNFINPLLVLSKDLYLLRNKIHNLKIKGFWQNPNCYIKNLDFYSDLLIDTKEIITSLDLPEKYISIHIRRGDYLSNKRLFDEYYSNFSPVKFILLSLKLLPKETENLPIYIISDDKKWANNMMFLLSSRTRFKFYTKKTNDHMEDWALLRHSFINICSNSTFSYTAALLNNENLEGKIRCIVPQWITKNKSSYEKGWLSPQGFIEI